MSSDSRYDELDRFLKTEIGVAEKQSETPYHSLTHTVYRTPAAEARSPPPPARVLATKVLKPKKGRVFSGKSGLVRVAGVLMLVLMTGAGGYYLMNAQVSVPQSRLSFDGSAIIVSPSGGSGSLGIVVHNKGDAMARIREIYINGSAGGSVLQIWFADEHCGGFICTVFGDPGSGVASNLLIVPAGGTVTVARPYQNDVPFRADASYLVTVSTLDTGDVTFVIQAKQK